MTALTLHAVAPRTVARRTRTASVQETRAVEPRLRVRLTPKGRRALALLVATPLLATGALIGAGVLGDAVSGAIASNEVATASFEHITVQPGQTLWQIAASIAPESDPREVVAEIELLNGISGAIQPGQQLALPLAYAE